MNEPNQLDSYEPQQSGTTLLGIEPSAEIISSPKPAYFLDAIGTGRPLSSPIHLIPHHSSPRISRVRPSHHPSRWSPPARMPRAHSSRRARRRVHAGFEPRTRVVPVSLFGSRSLPTHTLPRDVHATTSVSGNSRRLRNWEWNQAWCMNWYNILGAAAAICTIMGFFLAMYKK
ncbi:hypothetical protein DL93DRAFT_1677066 [Clavulina sp. PMI_390]|nr:hypothetical protein DL93DRAFT_1677066 [Clavulina sp. PMI_390]